MCDYIIDQKLFFVNREQEDILKNQFEPVVSGCDVLFTPTGGPPAGVTLIRNGEGVSLIDSGIDAAVVDGCIVPALAQLGLAPDDLDFVLCTHCHGDHIGGHARLRELAPRAKFGVFAAGAEKLRRPLFYSREIRAKFPAESPAPPAVLDGVEPDFLIEAGETVAGLRRIPAPGHDSDAVAFFEPEKRLLVTGDSVQGNGTWGQGIALYMDRAAYRDTLMRLMALNAEVLVAGHRFEPFPPVLPGEEKVRSFLEESLSFSEKYDILIREAEEEGIHSVPEIARRLLERIGCGMPEKLFLACWTVASHLKER